MCDPTLIMAGTLALSAATTAATIDAQKQAIKSTNQSNAVQAANIATAKRSNLANLEVERGQAAQDRTEQMRANNQAGMAARASALTAAGESGVGGISVDALLRDLAGLNAQDNSSAELSYLRRDGAINAARENVSINSNSQLNSLRAPAPVDYLGAGLKLGNDALGAYGTYRTQTSPPKRN